MALSITRTRWLSHGHKSSNKHFLCSIKRQISISAHGGPAAAAGAAPIDLIRLYCPSNLRDPQSACSSPDKQMNDTDPFFFLQHFPPCSSSPAEERPVKVNYRPDELTSSLLRRNRRPTRIAASSSLPPTLSHGNIACSSSNWEFEINENQFFSAFTLAWPPPSRLVSSLGVWAVYLLYLPSHLPTQRVAQELDNVPPASNSPCGMRGSLLPLSPISSAPCAVLLFTIHQRRFFFSTPSLWQPETIQFPSSVEQKTKKTGTGKICSPIELIN